MTLIIALHDDNTQISGCDRKCYDSRHDKCNCICGGRNHGVGYHQAIINARWLWLFPEQLHGWIGSGPNKTTVYVHAHVLEPLRQILATFSQE